MHNTSARLAGALLAAASTLAGAQTTITGTAHVIDGDTLQIGTERIRLHGIDAPEQRQQCYADDRAWPCGAQASAALARLCAGTPVTCVAMHTDRYGRTIAGCTARGNDIERAMVRNGWAFAYRRYSQDYVAEERLARAEQRGIWRGGTARSVLAPWRWRRGERLRR